MTIIRNSLCYQKDTPMELETKILALLQTKSEPTPTIEIASTVLGKGSSRKMVNPTLYKLAKEGKLVHLAEANGTNPRWSIKKE